MEGSEREKEIRVKMMPAAMMMKGEIIFSFLLRESISIT
jgi:hypothetical protein